MSIIFTLQAVSKNLGNGKVKHIHEEDALLEREIEVRLTAICFPHVVPNLCY